MLSVVICGITAPPVGEMKLYYIFKIFRIFSPSAQLGGTDERHLAHVFYMLIKCVFSPADLVLYCEAFLTTYRTFLTPEDLIKKLYYRYPFSEKPDCRTEPH